MQVRKGATARWAIATLGWAALAACGPNEEIQRQLAELQTVSAEKDSLLMQVTENARIMSDISVRLAAATAPAGAAGTQEAGGAPDPGSILDDIEALTVRLTESETRLEESQRRMQTLARESRTQQSKLNAFEKTVQDLQVTIDNQKQTIVSLTEQVENLQQQNVQLIEHNTVLTQAVDEITERENEAYYVIGTKDELLERGVITEEGGSRVLFVFGKRGKTLVPARDLDLSLFTKIDQRHVSEIPLPSADAEYRIVSLQDVSALETPPDENGRIEGGIRIADPGKFWANSKVLIIVEL